MKNRALIALLPAFLACASPSSPPVSGTGTALHPQPKEPHLIAGDLLPAFKKKIALPPVAGSDAQARDEEVLLRLQAERKPADCERARAEVYVSVGGFFGKPYGTLSDAEVAALGDFFAQIRNDADFYIQKLKKEFPRPRPFLYLKAIEPCVPKEVTGAYPSGHATLARLYALILSDLFPGRKTDFFVRGEMIANDRILSGMHHPSDIQAGKALADEIYPVLKKSPAYRSLYVDAKKAVSGPGS